MGSLTNLTEGDGRVIVISLICYGFFHSCIYNSSFFLKKSKKKCLQQLVDFK